jgi:tetratricopeptide (TPR) repeat protein
MRGFPSTLGWRCSGFALLVALTPAVARGQSLQQIFSVANQATFAGQWDSATRQYESLLKAGVKDPDVYFNLATTYARSGQLGKAVLNFERSLALRPGDDAAQKGLDTAVTLLGRKRAEKAGEATVRTRPPLSEALVRPWSENLLGWLVLGFDLALFAVLIALRSARQEALRVGLWVAGALLGLLLLVFGGGLLIKSEAFKEGRAAVVLREDAPLREGPDPRAQTRTKAFEGQAARLLERDGNFARVRLPDNSEGWMLQSDVDSI